MADKCHMSMSEYITCASIFNHINIIGDEESLKKIHSELNKIGSNVNQLRMLSQLGKIDVVNLDEFIDSLNDIKNLLNKILKEKTKWQP